LTFIAGPSLGGKISRYFAALNPGRARAPAVARSPVAMNLVRHNSDQAMDRICPGARSHSAGFHRGAIALLIAVTLVMAALAATPSDPIETALEAPGPLGPLQGTMLAPASGAAPVMLIIPGSGPTDRNGNNPLGVRASTYRLLAEGLAAQGIGTVRIDKRGMFGSRAAVADANAVTIDDYVSDVEAWTGSIRKQTGAACVWLIGHSEGGLVALAAAQKATDICGLVLVSTAGRPLGEVLRQQLRANRANAPILDQAMAAIDTLEAGRRVDVSAMNPALMPLFAPQVCRASW
jgi:uncharacterized protein